MSDIIELAKEHGIVAAISMLAIMLSSKSIWKQKDILSRVDTLEKEMDKVTGLVHVPPEVVKEMTIDIESLKIDNSKFETRLEFFTEGLNSLDAKIEKKFDKLDEKIDKLLQFHMEK